jgi:short-subunit dehydrogenase
MSIPAPSPTSAALVTGASAGIGSCIARELAARGHNLILVARREDRLQELAGELAAARGIRAEVLACDLADAGARAMVPARVAELGLEVDVLVNNAGFATNGRFDQADPERELEQVRVLVEAVVGLTSSFSPAMVQRRRGAILNVSSIAGMQPQPYGAGYSAAKAYVLTFSEALHHELRRQGVTVTALCPGPVATDFWKIAEWDLSGGQKLRRKLQSPIWISGEQAAKAGVDGLAAGRRVVVPHAPIRAAMGAGRYLPHRLKLPVLERSMRPR